LVRGGWAAWSSSWVGPVAGDEVGVPAQQCLGETSRSPRRFVGNSLLRALRRARSSQVSVGGWVASAQHGDLVTEDQYLGVFLSCVGSGEQRQPAQHAGEQQIGESEGHSGRSWGAGCGP
jgi:hypothetical protein